jgi:hypothetical protein
MPSKKQSADDKVNQEAQEYLRKAGGLSTGGRRTRGSKDELAPEKPIKKVNNQFLSRFGVSTVSH